MSKSGRSTESSLLNVPEKTVSQDSQESSLSFSNLDQESKELSKLAFKNTLSNNDRHLGLPELQIVETPHANEQLLAGRPVDQSLNLIGELKTGGQVVRERYHDASSGQTRDFVVARHQGQEYRFEDKPITTIPFDSGAGLESWRKKQIEQRSDKIIEEYAPRGAFNSKGTYDFKEFGDTLTRISKMTDLTEQEKAYLWDNIMGRRGKDYNASNHGSREVVRDSLMPWDVGHALLQGGFKDRYHVPLANLSQEAASREIYIHELNEGTGKGFINEFGHHVVSQIRGVKLNTGDIAASEVQVAALRAYKEHGFAGYAEVWRQGFLEK
ncbi:MAG: hypothetical protein SFV17_12755 [Candidatus Obscuribacter sp.]|nr:hypothetical protein [Candidatus Melainabacteria bacterium]MDX1987549.1 hypothetical protein [Candidatus Obscuribacter sp.]